MGACPTCGKLNDAEARFCSACGTRIEGERPTVARKTVTILFCDVTGSTAMGEKLDPEAARRVMARYFATARDVLERHGGTVEKFIGDAVMAVFGIPRLHEDDALRAVRAADRLRASIDELEVRIGVNTGEVVTGAGETLVTGDAVNVAARLEQAAQPGEVLMGAQTYRLVRDAVDVEAVGSAMLRGKSDPVDAYRLLRTREHADPFTRTLDAPLVGRRPELTRLEEAHARALRDESCHIVTLLGAPGIGKSRLAREFVARLGGEVTMLGGRCLAYGDGITYWPLVEIVRELGSDAEIVRRLRREPTATQIVNDVLWGIGLAEGASRPEETSRAVRKLFEALARERPLTVLLDDLQWAEPTFLDLVEHVAVLSRDAPIMLLCLARPELLDNRPRWCEGLANATTLRLEPLTDDEAEVLMTNLIEGGRLDDDVRQRVASAAAGNPLFVEQMLAMLTERSDGDVAIPPTIQALLAARLDRLESPERTLLECASVVGKEFWHSAVADLGSDPTALPGLVRRELIRPHRSTSFPTDDAYQFRHDLIRDAAYAEIPKERRADLHERCAVWLERRSSEHDEIVGYHLEQAHDFRLDVGETDERTRELGVRAGRLLGAAGMRAADRADIPATINLLARAVALLPVDDERALDLLIHLGYAHVDVNALDQALTAFAAANERATAAGHAVVLSRGTVGRLSIGFSTGESLAGLRESIGREIEKLRELGSPIGLAEAYREAAKAESHIGQTEKADRLFERAVENARLSGSRRVESDIIVWRLAMQCWGYLPARAGIRATTALLDEGKGGLGDAFALVVRGRYRALQGDLTGGREDMQAGRALIREFGAKYYIWGSGQENAMLELEAENPAAAEACLRETLAIQAATGRETLNATSVAMLARALADQGRFDEAEKFARMGQTGPIDDLYEQAARRYVQARVLANCGNLVGAEQLAREAVVFAEQTDFLEEHAQALLTLASVLEPTGRADEVRDALERALRLYERKESLLGIERVRARLRELADEPLAERQ